jgi:hypothetical protein
MDSPLSSGYFAPHVGDHFELQLGDGEGFEVVLESCDETRYGSHEQWLQSIDRVPFSLTFLAPGGQLVPQGTFTVRHEKLGELAIFLVPLGPKGGRGMAYEAVFS